MRHSKHNTETTESRFLGTISAFSIWNHHDTMEERAAKENKDGENGARGYGVECPPRQSHLPSADLDCPVPISPTHLADLACPAPISLLPFIFFSFFLHSSPISPVFFLSFADLAWVFLLWLFVDFLGLGCCGFYCCGCGLALRSEFLALISVFFFFLGLIIKGWAVFGCWENEGKSQFLLV